MGLVICIILGIHKTFYLGVNEKTFTAEEVSANNWLWILGQDEVIVGGEFLKL